MKNNEHCWKYSHWVALKRLSEWLFVVLFCGITLPVLAETLGPALDEETVGKWYQIEMLVFTQESIVASESETWRRDIELSYPNNMVKLVDPKSDIAEQPMEYIFSSDIPPPTSYFEPKPAGESPFVLLPTDQLNLNKARKKLAQYGIFRTLFHQAWRQQLQDQQDAPAILIKGGDSYNAHHELEGFIRVSVARYLHVETNLWYGQYKPNVGQPQENWPLLPPEPLINLADDKFKLDEPIDTLNLWENYDLLSREEAILLQSDFLLERLVTMVQKRRMRSGELHYLDHPLFGVLVRIDPYEPEPLIEVDITTIPDTPIQ